MKRMGTMIGIMVICLLCAIKSYSQEPFKYLSEHETNKQMSKVDKKNYKDSIEKIKITGLYNANIFIATDNKNNIIMCFLYGVIVYNSPFSKSLGMSKVDKGWEAPYNYVSKKILNKEVYFLTLGEFNETGRIGLLWIDNTNLNVDLLSKGLGEYYHNYPEDVIISWNDVGVFDYTFWNSAFYYQEKKAKKNKTGLLWSTK